MIYTITFNPSLDYIMHLESFQTGETNRSSCEQLYPGGKGFNVSTILHRLKIKTVALGFIAGFTGQEIKKQLALRGFSSDLCELEMGVSRINVKMKGQNETEINGNGPYIPDYKVQELFEKLDYLEDGDVLVLAGSIPSSMPNDIYLQIMKRLHSKDIQIVVDATKELLRASLPYHPFLIKPNQDELEELFEVKINNRDELIHYAKQLQSEGARNVLVSMGKEGALLLSEDKHIYHCPAAKGELINSVGSGDSMVAGFLGGYLKSKSYQEALTLGSACGGATAFSEDLAQGDLIQKIYQQLESEKIV